MASSSSQAQQQPINYSSDASNTTAASTTSKGPVTFDEDLFLFLPRLGDILKSFEKNPSEVKVKVEELRLQFESCQEMITRVEGIDTTIDDQRTELERLDHELKSKTELLKKHIHMCKFDLNMPAKVNRIISETEDDMTQQSLQNSSHAMNVNDDDEEEPEDDEDLFQSDDPTHHHHHHHPEGANEHLSPFFP